VEKEMSETIVKPLTPEQGLFELTLMNGEVADSSFDTVVVEAIDRGLPPEIITRLKELWDKTKVIAGEIVSVGKIIVQKILEFLKSNPQLTIGLAIGAAVSVLIAGIPIIGPLLAPLSTVVTTLYGAGVGALMAKGDHSGSIFSAAIELANKFFELLKSIFTAIIQYWSET
jgi:hypothetical protein